MRTMVFATLVALALGLIDTDAQAVPVNATPIYRAAIAICGTQQVQWWGARCVRRCNWRGHCWVACR